MRQAGLVVAALVVAAAVPLLVEPVAACEAEPVTPNTPTGIAGCVRLGDGIASHYGPGDGVATNACTWEIRHSTGCGQLAIQSHATGIVVVVDVVDFCDCYTGTPDERVVDLQYGVVDALGLNRADGLYAVTVWRPTAPAAPLPTPVPLDPDATPIPAPAAVLPDTAADPRPFPLQPFLVAVGVALMTAGAVLLLDAHIRRTRP